MGYDTYFAGVLEFTRRLTQDELAWVQKVLIAGQYHDHDPETEIALRHEGKTEREARDGGPLMYPGHNNADFRAMRRGFVVHEGVSAGNAGDLNIAEDGRGLEYRSEKSYYMVEAVNFVIANAKQRIPDFGLKGQLVANTEFEPYDWLLKISEDGWAHQVPVEPEPPSRFTRIGVPLMWLTRLLERRAWKRRMDRAGGPKAEEWLNIPPPPTDLM
jgi:hypothetical protein